MEDKYSRLKVPQKLFVQGKKYANSSGDLTVLCAKTTCNYSSKTFKGTVLQAKEYSIGHFSKDWLTSGFKEYKEENE
jgi:hypothetical protein